MEEKENDILLSIGHSLSSPISCLIAVEKPHINLIIGLKLYKAIDQPRKPFDTYSLPHDQLIGFSRDLTKFISEIETFKRREI